MHELSLALNIVHQVEEELVHRSFRQVNSVEIELGSLAGVDRQLLQSVWPFACRDTLLEHSSCYIKSLHARALCQDCQQEFILKNLVASCPYCSSYRYEILEGMELKIKSVTLKE